MFKRTEESKLTSWYFETDRKLLWLVFLMIFVAMIIAISSGSANFVRTAGKTAWYVFFLDMLKYYLIGVAVMIGVSMTDKKTVLKLAWADLIVFFVLLIGTMVYKHPLNGSLRWFIIRGVPRIMPSELMKPGFIIITTWFISKMRSVYGNDAFNLKRTLFQVKTWSWVWYLVPFAIMAIIQFKHPDAGTMLLYAATLGVMLLFGGMPMKQVWALLGFGIGLGGVCLLFLSHVFSRTLALFGPLDPYSQIGFALRAIRNGGLFGAGDKAHIVEGLAMSESDFVLSVIAENFGAIAACGLIIVLALVVRHLLKQSRCVRDEFTSIATAGTAAMFGIQVCINLGSTLRLIPAKGMTLPFISHGGSSLVAYCFLFGMILALIREDKWK